MAMSSMRIVKSVKLIRVMMMTDEVEEVSKVGESILH